HRGARSGDPGRSHAGDDREEAGRTRRDAGAARPYRARTAGHRSAAHAPARLRAGAARAPCSAPAAACRAGTRAARAACATGSARGPVTGVTWIRMPMSLAGTGVRKAAWQAAAAGRCAAEEPRCGPAATASLGRTAAGAVGGLLGEDQLVVAGMAQAVHAVTVVDQDLALATQQLFAAQRLRRRRGGGDVLT